MKAECSPYGSGDGTDHAKATSALWLSHFLWSLRPSLHHCHHQMRGSCLQDIVLLVSTYE
jgi:hypothetical protein